MPSDAYPFDPEVRQRVTELLYELLPSVYRVLDAPPKEHGKLHEEPPKEHGKLHDFLSILAAPLAEVRQSVEELHADLFIDSCDDQVLAHLAEMVGTTLVFPDADSNRRDVRGATRWRRRKGSPAMLEELGAELFNRTVVTQEGWKRLLMTQDMNVPRLERTVPRVRDLLLAEKSTGPLDAISHALDARPISARAGRYHPRHLVHWTYPTQLFPVRHGSGVELPERGEPYVYVFNPHWRSFQQQLRIQQGVSEEGSATDRVPPMSFAKEPERFFGREGGFTVYVAGLKAAVGEEELPSRQACAWSAEPELVGGAVEVHLLEHTSRGLHVPVTVELFAVPLDEGRVQLQAASFRGRLTLTRAGGTDSSSGFAPVETPHVAMLRLSYEGDAATAFLPEATVELVSSAPEARLGTRDAEVAREGFLRGALLVRLPALWVEKELWLHVAADGSLYAAEHAGTWLSLEAKEGRYLLQGPLVSLGPGAAWPPAPASASDELLTRVPGSLVRGPVFMHGGPALKGSEPVAEGTRMALAFGVRYVDANALPRYQPVLRLEWTGPEPWRTASWTALDADGAPTAMQARFRELAALRESAPRQFHLVARLEGDVVGLVLPPCEVTWPDDEGATRLLHLPRLSTTAAATPGLPWRSSLATVGGTGVSLGNDGSSRAEGSTQILRYALGTTAVAPIRERVTLQRRRPRSRELLTLTEGRADVAEGARRGWLDIDCLRGRFAFDATEPPQAPPPRRDGARLPPAVTVDYQEGHTAILGALPVSYAPLRGEPQPAPTRRVALWSASDLSAAALEVPVYSSLTEAMNAIAEDPAPAEHEVIQFEDSALHTFDAVTWAGARERPLQLTIQAADAERPFIEFGAFGGFLGMGHLFERITLRGLDLRGAFHVVDADKLVLEFCVLMSGIHIPSSHRRVDVQISHSRIPMLFLDVGSLSATDTIIRTLRVQDGTCALKRVTVLDYAEARVLEATDSLFDGMVTVHDRFRGCVRYSRVPKDAVLPRRHRVVEDVAVRFVTRTNPYDPAYVRLAADCDARITRGAEDGSEMGAFHGARLAQRYEALKQRLEESTPAGLVAEICRLD